MNNTPLHKDVASYIVRHWKGEHSLARSYWLNGIVFGAFLAAMLAVIGFSYVESSHSTLTPALKGTVLWMIFLTTIPFLTWKSVGIWRSSVRYSKEKKFWGGAARTMIVLDVIYVCLSFILFTMPKLLELFGLYPVHA